MVRPRCPGPFGDLRRRDHKRLEGVWPSPVVVPIERKDRGGHPTGRRDLDEDRMRNQRRGHARRRSKERGNRDGDVHCDPQCSRLPMSSGVQAAVVRDGRRTGYAVSRRLRRRGWLWPDREPHCWTPSSRMADHRSSGSPTHGETFWPKYRGVCHEISVFLCPFTTFGRCLAADVALPSDDRLGVVGTAPSAHPSLDPPRGARELCRSIRRTRPVPTEDQPHEQLLRELGRINTELALQRRESAMTAHDLASPAQVILGLSEILLDHQNLDPVVRRRIEQVHRSAVTMSTLISDLSNGLALDDRANLETRRLSLGEVLSSVVDRTRLLAEAKDMDLLFIRQSGGQGCWVDGDAVKLERALANLLGNAIKFSPPRSMVTVTLDWGSTHARIAVEDEGRGSATTGTPASSRSSTVRPTAPTCPASASACTSPSRSSRAMAARSRWIPSPVVARPSSCRSRWPWTCRSPGSADRPAWPVRPYRRKLEPVTVPG